MSELCVKTFKQGIDRDRSCTDPAVGWAARRAYVRHRSRLKIQENHKKAYNDTEAHLGPSCSPPICRIGTGPVPIDVLLESVDAEL